MGKVFWGIVGGASGWRITEAVVVPASPTRDGHSSGIHIGNLGEDSGQGPKLNCEWSMALAIGTVSWYFGGNRKRGGRNMKQPCF